MLDYLKLQNGWTDFKNSFIIRTLCLRAVCLFKKGKLKPREVLKRGF